MTKKSAPSAGPRNERIPPMITMASSSPEKATVWLRSRISMRCRRLPTGMTHASRTAMVVMLTTTPYPMSVMSGRRPTVLITTGRSSPIRMKMRPSSRNVTMIHVSLVCTRVCADVTRGT